MTPSQMEAWLKLKASQYLSKKSKWGHDDQRNLKISFFLASLNDHFGLFITSWISLVSDIW